MIDDKFQQHYRQQMSALMDGELAPDQARFLMRRMGEDQALNATWERWQLCGEVLRGRAPTPAPHGFAERVAAAVAEQPRQQPAANQEFGRGGHRLLRWSGGAVAASVALVVMFIAGQHSRPQVASQATELASNMAPASGGSTIRSPSAPSAPADPDPAATLAASAAVAVASVPRRADESRRGSATRNQQAARATAAITRQALAKVNAAKVPRTDALAQAPSSRQDPFAGAALGEARARPWPRATLPHLAGDGSYAAGYVQGEQAPYYPFQPRLPTAASTSQPSEARAPDAQP